MPEGESFFGKVRRLFAGAPQETAPIEAGPEQKAKKAFYNAVARSLTEDKLQSISDFEPPNGGFDLSALGDGAVFRVLSTKKLSGETKNLTFKDVWDYLCVVIDPSDRERKLYRPRDVDWSDGESLVFHHIYNVPTLERGYDQVRVEETPFENTRIDWEAPLKTLPFRALAGYYMGQDFDHADVEVHKIEVVDGGKTVTLPTRGQQEERRGATSYGSNPLVPDVS